MSPPEHGRPPDHKGPYVVERLEIRGHAGVGLAVARSQAETAALRAFVAGLADAGVTLPPDCEVVERPHPAVRHRWVPGPRLPDVAVMDSALFIESVTRIGTWVRVLADRDIRLDASLSHFRICRGSPMLADVLPPLLTSRRPVPRNSLEVLLDAMRFDTAVILDALVGYATRVLLRSTTLVNAREFLPVARDLALLASTSAAAGFPASWFRARTAFAIRALEVGGPAVDVLPAFFALTSVRTFRRLTEPARLRRIALVASLIERSGPR